MKKIRFAQLAIVSLMCAALFTGCPNTPDEETPDTSATLQEQIDNASSVKVSSVSSSRSARSAFRAD